MVLGKPPDRQTLIFLEDGSNITDKCLFPHPHTEILLLLARGLLPHLYDLVKDLNQSFRQAPVSLLSPNCF